MRVQAIYDACVLYPAPLRDFLVQLAISGPFDARWTNAIHDEWIRNLLKERPDLDPKALIRTRQLMDIAIGGDLVERYELWMDELVLPDPNDRHVLAAAIHSSAHAIVTFNVADFPSKILTPYAVEALHPDDYIGCIIEVSPKVVCMAEKICRLRLKKPPFTVEEYIKCLAKQQLTATAAFLRENTHEI